MSRLEMATGMWLINGGKSPLALWPSLGKSIPIKIEGYATVMNKDGEFHCPHEEVEIEYEPGGDGRTEPGESWSVYCPDCWNDDMPQWQVDQLVEEYNEERLEPFND